MSRFTADGVRRRCAQPAVLWSIVAVLNLAGAVASARAGQLPADCNTNGIADAQDIRLLVDCLTGPCAAGPCNYPADPGACCAGVDFDADIDVDLRDYAAMLAQEFCMPGFFVTSNGCLPCEDGSVSAQFGAMTCEFCSVGSASINGVSCTPCAPGYYAPLAGMAFCAPCAAGSFADTTGLAECALCPPGSAAANFASTMCDLCTNGTVAPMPGSDACEPCDPGDVSTNGITCEPCPAGTFEAGDVCAACTTGFFTALSGQTVCSPCSPGYFADSNGLDECEPCLAGSVAMSNGSAECEMCTNGLVAPSQGLTVCVPCAPGDTSTNGIDCVPCPPGTIGSNSVCEACTDGIAPVSGTIACTPCPPGGVTTNGITCEPCPPGTFDSNGVCEPCDPGTITNSPGSIECAPCPPGTAQDLSGQDECLPCPLNSTPVLGATTCWCEEEYFTACDTNGMNCYCAECPIGTQCDAGSCAGTACDPNGVPKPGWWRPE